MKYLLVFILIFSMLSSQAQQNSHHKVLVAKSKKTGNSYAITPNGEVVVTAMDNSITLRGGLAILNDSTLIVGGKAVSVHNLSSVKISKKGPKVFGGILIGLGVVGVVIGMGSKNFASMFPKESLTYSIYNGVGTGYLVLGSVVGFSGLIIATVKKRYSAKSYDFKIVSL